MKSELPLLATIGDDPMSEENVQRRLRFLREGAGRGTVFIPKSWAEADPALAQAVEELDWIRVA